MWKNIPGYEGRYEINEEGYIKSTRLGKEKILKLLYSSSGYCQVFLSNKPKGKMQLVHRLVAKVFIPNPENKVQINHKNGNKYDNRVENLEWCTVKENIRHSWKLGLNNNNHLQLRHPDKGKFGKDNKKSKIVNQYSLEGVFIKKWHSIMDIKRELGINNISACCRGKKKQSGGFKWEYA